MGSYFRKRNSFDLRYSDACDFSFEFGIKKMEFLKSDLKLKFVLRFDHLVFFFDETSCFNQSERALFQKFAIFKQPNSFSMFPWSDQIAKTNDRPVWHVHMDFGESPRQPFPSIELFLRNTCESKTFQSCLHIPA